MQRFFTAASLAAFVGMAACSGGGGGTNVTPGGGSTPAPSTSSTPAPSTSSNPASMPTTATIGGQTVYVGTNNGHTLYHTTGDANDVSNCTAANGCTNFWFPYAAPAGTVVPSGTNFSVFKRSDGTYQWALSGHPLYEFYADTAAGQNNGNGFVDAYGTWSEAIADGATASPAPTSTPYALR